MNWPSYVTLCWTLIKNLFVLLVFFRKGGVGNRPGVSESFQQATCLSELFVFICIFVIFLFCLYLKVKKEKYHYLPCESLMPCYHQSLRHKYVSWNKCSVWFCKDCVLCFCTSPIYYQHLSLHRTGIKLCCQSFTVFSIKLHDHKYSLYFFLFYFIIFIFLNPGSAAQVLGLIELHRLHLTAVKRCSAAGD